MTQKCSFCAGSVERVPIQGIDLRLCTECHATFISAKNFLTVRREVDEGSRKSWVHILRHSQVRFKSPGQVLCIDHATPLVDGNLPDYVIPAKVPTCCQTQHLPPELWANLLEKGIKNPMRNLTAHHQAQDGLKGKILKWMQARLDKDHSETDPLDNIVFDMKLKPLLERHLS